MVGSGGIQPWRDIELLGQEQTFGEIETSVVEIVWLEANPSLDRSVVNRILDYLFKRAYSRFDSKRSGGGLRTRFRRLGVLILSWTLWALLDHTYWTTKPIHVGRRVTFNFPTLHHLHSIRQLHYFQYVLENFDFDFVLKTTSTCYVDIKSLSHFVATLTPKRVYSGPVYSRFGIPFVSGAAALFSRDVVESIVRLRKQLRVDFWEDVTLGELIRTHGLAYPTEFARVDVPKQTEISREFVENFRRVPFVYRCKASAGYTRELGDEIERMKRLHLLLQA